MAATLLILLTCSAVACQRHSNICGKGSVTYFDDSSLMTLADNAESQLEPQQVEIKGKMTEVDRVISGPICADTWSGTVYVSCDIQIAQWEEAPLFFEECPLVIKPETKVYVASHNDSVYYKGCSCHTGELADQ